MALIGDDCYFYYNATCLRGESCTFRHQPAALSIQDVCPEWQKGSCFKPTCTLRHMLVDHGERNKIPCYWESQSSGCLKPNCPYMHVRKANLVNPALPANNTGSFPSNVGNLPVGTNAPHGVNPVPSQSHTTAMVPQIAIPAQHLGASVRPGLRPIHVLPLGHRPIFQNLPRQALPLHIANRPRLLQAEVRLQLPQQQLQAGLAAVASQGQSTLTPTQSQRELTHAPGLLPSQSNLLPHPSSENSKLPTKRKTMAPLPEEPGSVIPRGTRIHVKPSLFQHAKEQAAKIIGPQGIQYDQSAMHGSHQGNSQAENLSQEGRFADQVRLFKEMLATKTRQARGVGHENYTKGNYYDGNEEEHFSPVDSDELSDSSLQDRFKRDKRKASRHRRNTDKRRGRTTSYNKRTAHNTHKKKEKDIWTKAERELLEGDYKEVPLDSKEKKKHRSHNGTQSDSDLSELKVKSYDEILREKALRKSAARKKHHSDDEQRESDISKDDVIPEKKKSKNKSKKVQLSDEDSGRKNSKGSKSSKSKDQADTSKKSLSDSEATEKGTESKSKDSKSGTKKKTRNNLLEDGKVSSKTLDTADQSIVEVLPGSGDISLEVASGDISIDDDKTDVSSEQSPKKMSSIINIISPSDKTEETGRNTAKNSSSDGKKKKRTVSCKPEVTSEADQKPTTIEIFSPPEKETDLETLSSISSKPDSSDGKSRIESPKKADKVLVKTFDEIMAEKRKRKLALNDSEVHVISDDNDSSAEKERTTSLQQKSDAAKASILSSNSSRKVTTLPNVSKVSSPSSPVSSSRFKNDQDAAEKRTKITRKSIQLYKPPGKTEDQADTKASNTQAPDSSEKDTSKQQQVPSKVVRIRKLSGGGADMATATGEVKVKSFEDIMKEKRLRRQQQQNTSEKPVSTSNSLQSRKHRFLKRPNTATTTDSSTVPSKTDDKDRSDSNVARVTPFTSTEAPVVKTLRVVPPKRKQMRLRSESVDEDALLNDDSVVDVLIEDGPIEENNPREEKFQTEKIENGISKEFSEKSTTQVETANIADVSNASDIAVTSSVPTVENSSAKMETISQFDSKSNNESREADPSKIFDVVSNGVNTTTSLEVSKLDTTEVSTSQCSLEDIKEALDKERKKREDGLLSDDELEREFDDLSSVDDEDINEDDLMMELEEMIGDD